MLKSEEILKTIKNIDERILLIETKSDLVGIDNLSVLEKEYLKKLCIEKKRLLNDYDEAKFDEYIVNYNREIILRRSNIYKRPKKDKEV